jgi:PAS domain S-box-containing protein
MTLVPQRKSESALGKVIWLAKYVATLLVLGATYFVLAKAGLALASIHPSASPVWPATGLALGSLLVGGIRLWPAILVGALAANATNEIADAASLDVWLTSAAIAIGNTLESVVGAYLIRRWSDGARTFETTLGVAKFALIAVAPGAMISATVGVGSLSAAGEADWANFAPIWLTWWLGDVASALVVAPVVVLWITERVRPLRWIKLLESVLVLLCACAIGVVAFSPLLEQTTQRTSLAFLAVLPLIWAALRRGPRDTATVVLILTGFAVWGTYAGGGPFEAATLNEAFLLLIVFVISIAVPSLALSADVAMRKRVEATLRQRELDLRAIFSQAVVGIAQVDTTGRFKLVNERFCEIVQRSAGDLKAMSIQDLIHRDDLPRVLELLSLAVRTGEGFAIESRYVRPDSYPVWVRNNVSAILDPAGAVRQLVAVTEDVTARRRAEENLRRARDDLERMVLERTAALKQANDVLNAEIEQRKHVEAALVQDFAERRKAQEALTESERRFRLFIQGVTDYAIFMLDPDGYITNWNSGAQRIHHYAAGEIVGQHFGCFYTEEEQQRGEPARALQVAAYEGKHVAEGWWVRRDESVFWASIVIEAIRDESGTLAGYAVITRDISERREAQEALARAQEQLAQSQKMEALGQLTGSIAHDFNNLLMIVSGHAQLLRRRLSDPKHLQAVEAVHAAASRGESLTRQLLAFSRRQPLSPVVVDLKERVEAVHEMLLGSLRGNIELKRDIPADIWPVEIDIAELELALVNIAVNARDAMPGGGTITVSGRNASLTKSDGVDQLEGDFVALSVADTGVGIAPDVLPRIFEPFFTTKALGKGTGLGLSQVYGFSHQSGGTVVATSEVGSGTTITLYLPRSHATLTRIAEAPSVQPAAPAQGTILVVDDNPEVADVTASLIEQLGYRTLRAENARDALNQLQRGNRINLVLSDIVMPGGMNGMALAQEITNRYPQVGVLLSSGYSDMVQAAEARFVILRKPFQLPLLEKAIREALERIAAPDDGGRVLPFPQERGNSRA